MAEDVVVDEDVVEEVKKPDVVFEDEWEIIPEGQEPDEPEAPAEPPKPDEEELERLVQERLDKLTPQTDSTADLAEVLKGLKTTLEPKAEVVEPIDWKKVAEEVADDLSRDPAKAIETLTNKINQNVGGAFQYQQNQLLEQQKQTSKIVAKTEEGLKMVFDNWGDEVDTEAAKITVAPGQSALSVYNEAAAKVKMNHLDEVIAMKVAELAKPTPDAKLQTTGLSATPSSGPVEGQTKKKARYSATPAQMLEIKRSINPDIMREKLIRTGQLKRIN